jgi:hypothetical protein
MNAGYGLNCLICADDNSRYCLMCAFERTFFYAMISNTTPTMGCAQPCWSSAPFARLPCLPPPWDEDVETEDV